MSTGVRTVVAVLLLSIGAAIGFYAFQDRLASTWLAFSLHPDVRNALTRSLEDQKRLAKLDPANDTEYRKRFDETRRLESRLEVLALNRDELTRRYDLLLSGLFLGGVLLISAWFVFERRRQERRLARLRGALTALSVDGCEVEVDDRGRDTIGRIARMIEETSRAAAKRRRRIDSLRHLETWQEAARRHAHEIRTPLTSLQLEIERLADLARNGANDPEALEPLAEAIQAEIGALRRFTYEYSSFATIGVPKKQRVDVGRLLASFAETFHDAWDGIELDCAGAADGYFASFDSDMIRRVLVNLSDNSARAMPEGGRIRISTVRDGDWITIVHEDDGRGIPVEIRARLFEPYNTTRKPGEGMGLGLAIARKILLDHGGELELAFSTSEGTRFRLLLPTTEGGAA